jgi:diguanylate cyclase (GGDEF)-like protein
LLLQNIRNCDVAGRYGGEELVVIIPGLDLVKARQAATKIASKIAEHAFEGMADHVTISGGVCQIRQNSADQVLKNVGPKLYDAKHQGRNLILVRDSVS